MLKFLLLVNKQGHPRAARYYDHVFDPDDRLTAEMDIVRKTLSHDHKQCCFVDHQDFRLIYRKYLNLYFIVGADKDENELAIYELLHCIVEVLDKYFDRVSEVDIMYNLDRVHMILDEMILNGHIVETSQQRILATIQLMDADKK